MLPFSCSSVACSSWWSPWLTTTTWAVSRRRSELTMWYFKGWDSWAQITNKGSEGLEYYLIDAWSITLPVDAPCPLPWDLSYCNPSIQQMSTVSHSRLYNKNEKPHSEGELLFCWAVRSGPSWHTLLLCAALSAVIKKELAVCSALCSCFTYDLICTSDYVFHVQPHDFQIVFSVI